MEANSEARHFLSSHSLCSGAIPEKKQPGSQHRTRRDPSIVPEGASPNLKPKGVFKKLVSLRIFFEPILIVPIEKIHGLFIPWDYYLNPPPGRITYSKDINSLMVGTGSLKSRVAELLHSGGSEGRSVSCLYQILVTADNPKCSERKMKE